MNPWKEVALSDYENHMSLDSIAQLQALNEMMRGQIYDHDVSDVMIMGIAGGNGLNHIDPVKIRRVYGVDINGDYLRKCRERFVDLGDSLVTIQADLNDESTELPHADLVVANLLLEYVGYAPFARNIQRIAPQYVSVIIQINEGEGFVSHSPYQHSFDRLNEVYHHIDSAGLTEVMKQIGYNLLKETKQNLPNGKALARLDFCIKN